jgi:hypothetical protein
VLSRGVLEVVVTCCNVFPKKGSGLVLANIRRGLALTALLALASLGASQPALAQNQATSQTTDQSQAASDSSATSVPAGQLAIQLNKLEPQGKSCRAYLVIKNKSATAYPTFKVDLIEFRTDGIIGHRFLFDLGPIRANKEAVKLFDLDTPCDQIGSFLVNDVTECKTDAGPANDCLKALTLSSRAKAQLTK